MKRILLVGAIAATPLFAMSAVAADMPTKGPAYKAAPEPMFNWTGFYVGLDAGGAWARQDVSDDPCAGACGTLPASSQLKGGGFIGGIYGGYNFMFAPNWLAGVEADWSWTRLHGATSTPQFLTAGGTNPLPEMNGWSRTLNWLASLRGRLGITPSATSLLYVTGGAAWGGARYAAQDIFSTGCPNCAVTSFSQTKPGYAIGGGGEWLWANNWIVRAEYLYYRLNGTSSTAALPGSALAVTFNWGELAIHEVRVGVAVKY
jgi:outer membrane immunogenic protein